MKCVTMSVRVKHLPGWTSKTDPQQESSNTEQCPGIGIILSKETLTMLEVTVVCDVKKVRQGKSTLEV